MKQAHQKLILNSVARFASPYVLLLPNVCEHVIGKDLQFML